MEEPQKTRSPVTPFLLFSCFCLLVGDLLFGYDTASFGGILGNPGFIRQFGSLHPQTNAWSLDPSRVPLVSSLPFIGKALGCLVAGPAIERYGHRAVFYLLSILSCIGVILEITAADTNPGTGRFAQFVVGRIVVYISIGLVEVNVTTYQSEIVPASIRGLVVVSLQLFLSLGAVIAASVNKAFSHDTSAVGWKTVTGIQFIFPCLIAAFVPFMKDSPRWLLTQDREGDALHSLRRLRRKRETESDHCEAEIATIKDALHQDLDKGLWRDLFRGGNISRTMVVAVFYFYQQATGQAFVSTYQTVFFQKNGYADKAFTFPIISACLSVISVLLLMSMVDRLGRRNCLMLSFILQALWLYVLAGIGQRTQKTAAESEIIVAAFILFSFFYNLGGASIPYLLGAEIPNSRVREKTQSLGATWNVLWAFVTNYSIPYLLSILDFKIGWIFGSIAVSATFYTFFFLPETKGRTLEEVDNLF